MSSLFTMLRFTGTSLVASLLFVAACATDSTLGADDGLDAGSPQIEAGVPGVDGGAPDAPDEPLPSTAKCGNFKVEQGETCDDGNTNDNDGCSKTCKLESAYEGDVCPGKPFPLQTVGAALTGSVSGTTATAYGQYGTACGGGSGKDLVYTFTPSSSGKAIVTLTSDFPGIVSARSTCTDATTESTCSDIVPVTGGSTTIEVPVFQGTPVYLFVDGYGGTSGKFTLSVDVSLAVCGNGIAELPETCDDGNATSGDGCSAECTLEALGVADACPGLPFQLSGPAGAPRKISFAGTTATHTKASQGASSCYFSRGKNSVYAVKSDITGAVKANLVTAFPKSSLHVRSDCADNDYQLGCGSTHQPGPVEVNFPVKAGQWFFLFVDQQEDNGGPFTLDVEVTPAACGNHVIDGNEECDDGNGESGDGCTPACKLEPLAGIDTCPGHSLTLTEQDDGSRTTSISGSTVGLSNAVSGCHFAFSSTSTSFSFGAPDAIFTVTPDIDGLLTADVTGPFNTVVSVLDRCEAPSTSEPAGSPDTVVACSYASWSPASLSASEPYIVHGLGSGPKTARGPVQAGHTYHVVVDSSSSGAHSSGPFELKLRVTPGICGNGIVEGAETCDDGGTDDNDGCSSTCTLEPTGPRNTCGTAENVAFSETAPNTWEALVKSGTTNLTRVHNFGSTESSAGGCYARGPDAFFKVTAPAAGVLRAKAQSSAFDVILGMQQCKSTTGCTCSNTTSPLSCSNSGPKGTEEVLSTTVTAGEVLYFIVDSPYPAVNGCVENSQTGEISPNIEPSCELSVLERGRFTLDLSLAPSACGDGFFVPSATEECDDGNTTDGDGCSSTCKLEAFAGLDTCPGMTLTLTGTGSQQRKGQVTFSTAALSADYAGACGGNGPEGVVRVVPNTSGVLHAKMRNMLTGTVHARAVCNDPSTEFFKKPGSSTCPSVVHEVVTFPVVAGNEYFLFVDGLDGTTGVPTLEVTVDP